MNLYSTHVVKRNLKNRNQKFKKYEKKKKKQKLKKYILKKGSYGQPAAKPTVVGPAVGRPPELLYDTMRYRPIENCLVVP